MISNSKQKWEVGQVVKVGFVTGLVVVDKIPTPGDYAPDAYVLRTQQLPERLQRWYRFIPHKGLDRRENRADALKA